MNISPFSSLLPYSPLPSGGESEDATSSDSLTNWSASASSFILNDEAVCNGGFPLKKRKAGRRKFKETRHPIFHGVRERDGGKWVCEIREPNKKSRIWLGTYPTAELAARAHDVGAIALRGDKAVLNFPNSAWLAPRAKSASAKDIRLAAFQATRSEFRSYSPSSGGGKEVDEPEAESSSIISYSGVNNYFETEGESNNKEVFIDEEEIFNYPSLINGMAAGMLLTPPCLKSGINWDDIIITDDYGTNSYTDYMDLWQHL